MLTKSYTTLQLKRDCINPQWTPSVRFAETHTLAGKGTRTGGVTGEAMSF
jgi:hypothetical protein